MDSPIQLTYAGLWLAVFASQLCIPIPALLLLIASGALCAQHHLSLPLVFAVGITGCLAGDGIWFWLGRHWGLRIIRALSRLSTDPRNFTRKAHEVFDRWGLRILVIAKFVPGLDGVTPPLAGAEGASVPRFLAFDTAGSALWTGVYVLLGFLFSNQLDIVVRRTKHFGTLILVLVVIAVVTYAAWRGTILLRMILQLRLRRMSPVMLERKIRDGDKVGIIDLLNYEDENEDAEGIPGAIRADPTRLRTGPNLLVPDDVDLVLYCTTQGEILSARVAVALHRRGVEKVWVLDGGLQAWKAHGFTVSKTFSTPEQTAARLGIRLPDEPVIVVETPGSSTAITS